MMINPLREDELFREVILSSFEAPVVLFIAFEDALELSDVNYVSVGLNKIRPDMKQFYIDPMQSNELVEDINFHLSKISAKNANAKTQFDIEFNAVSLTSPSLVIFENGETSIWYTNFEGRSQAAKSFLLKWKEHLLSHEKESLDHYISMLERRCETESPLRNSLLSPQTATERLKVALACVAGFALIYVAWSAYESRLLDGQAAARRLQASFARNTEITPEAFPTMCGNSNEALCIGKFIVWSGKIRTGIKRDSTSIQVKTFNGDADLSLSCRTEQDLVSGQEVVFHGRIKELNHFLPDTIVDACIRPSSPTLVTSGRAATPVQSLNESRSQSTIASSSQTPPSNRMSDTEAAYRNSQTTLPSPKEPVITTRPAINVGADPSTKDQLSRATQSAIDDRQARIIASLTGESVRSPQQDVSRSAAYRAGHDARAAWETWYDAMAGQFRDGAGWWAEHRSTATRDNLSCESQRAVPLPWVSGCQQARTMLTPSDQRRRADSEFKDGWNGT